MMGVPAAAVRVSLAGCAALALASCDASGSSIAGGAAGASGPARVAAGEPSAARLVSSALSAVRRASSVHVSGRLSRAGVPVNVDLNVARNGAEAGTVRQHGTSLQVIAANGKIYIEATPAFLREMRVPAAACASACGKWFELTQGEASQLTGNISMSSLLPLLAPGEAAKLTRAGSTTVHGRPAWLLRAGDGMTVAVSSSGRHYPLESTGGGSPHQVVTYSQWDSAPVRKPPPASQLLNPAGG